MKPNIVINVFQEQIMFKSYSLFMIISASLVFVLSLWNIRRAGLSIKSSLLCFLLMAVGVLVGSRLLNVLINWNYYMNNNWRIFAINLSGFSLMGGLILAGILGILSAKILKLPYWKLADAVAPGLGVGLITMRVGCFLNGCCYGMKTNLPWGVKFPYDSFSYRYYLQESLNEGGFSIFKLFTSPSVHPTQIYELIGALIATLVSIMIIRKKKTSGTAILAFSIIFTITRLINHFLRVHPSTNSIPFLFYPLLYLIIISIMLLLLYRLNYLAKAITQEK